MVPESDRPPEEHSRGSENEHDESDRINEVYGIFRGGVWSGYKA